MDVPARSGRQSPRRAHLRAHEGQPIHRKGQHGHSREVCPTRFGIFTLSYSRTCNIGTNTLIGSATKVSENVSITASVIGQRCNIGAGSKISGSYIFEGAIIGEQCIIERSIIGAGVQVKDGSHIPKGCLLADGVVVGPDASLQPFERLSVSRDKEDGDSEDDADEDSDIEEVEASKF